MCGNGFNSFYIPERQGEIILWDNVCSEKHLCSACLHEYKIPAWGITV